ncbi:MAG TPA: RES family NAD+ phosphorylase [bacterium]|nr:RES family NAD+ phosphorylase [bacterium]
MVSDRRPYDPTPPIDLAARTLPLTTIESPAWRVYPGTHDPSHFNKQDGRFNDPQQQYGVVYAAATEVGAFAERLLLAPGLFGGPTSLAAGGIPVSATALQTFSLAAITFVRPLACVDLRTPTGLVQIGAGPWLITAPHSVSKQWSRPIFLHPSAPEGIVWSSRAGQGVVSLGLHERAKPKITAQGLGPLIGQRKLLAEAIREFDVIIVPT